MLLFIMLLFIMLLFIISPEHLYACSNQQEFNVIQLGDVLMCQSKLFSLLRPAIFHKLYLGIAI